MAGGPLLPSSAYPVTAGNLFPNIYVSAGANSKHEEGLGVAASIAADSTWRLRFQLPPSLPTGTAKLRLLMQANATSGNAKINPKSAVVAAGSDPGGATLTAEGTQTVSWGAGDNDKYKELKVTLTPTMVASNVLVMDLVFETASWTLAQILNVVPMLIWE